MSVFLVSFILANSAFLLSVGLVAGVQLVFILVLCHWVQLSCCCFILVLGHWVQLSCCCLFLVLCHWGSRCEMRATGFCFYFLIAH